MLRLYNGSKFHVRHKYNEVFPDFPLSSKTKDEVSVDGDTKVYKIKYILNVLPNIDESQDSLMEAIAETDELEIFENKVLRDFIDFKWIPFR